MQSFFFKKNSLHTLDGGGDKMLYLQMFMPFLKVPSLTFYSTDYALSSRTTETLCFFSTHIYGYETFKTVLSLNCEVI